MTTFLAGASGEALSTMSRELGAQEADLAGFFGRSHSRTRAQSAGSSFAQGSLKRLSFRGFGYGRPGRQLEATQRPLFLAHAHGLTALMERKHSVAASGR